MQWSGQEETPTDYRQSVQCVSLNAGPSLIRSLVVVVKPVLAGLLHPFTQPMSSGAGKGIELRERLEEMNRVVASLNDKVRLQQEEMQRMGQEQKRAPDVLSQSQKEIVSDQSSLPLPPPPPVFVQSSSDELRE